MEENNVVDLQKVLKDKEAELNKIIGQIKQITDDMRTLQENKDRLTERGLEVRGGIKVIQELLTLQKAQELLQK